MAEAAKVDAHQHFCSLGEVEYRWLDAAPFAPIHRDLGPCDLEPLLRAAPDEVLGGTGATADRLEQ